MCYHSQAAISRRNRGNGRSSAAVPRPEGGRTIENEVLLADEAPIHELDELRQLIADGQERGFLTFDEIATALEEVEVTKEQVQELHVYLSEHGIDVVGSDGKQVSSEGA